jgi:myo-inositol 2-dehydrogenase/D-chiro-inositol 1-dehydrogenase
MGQTHLRALAASDDVDVVSVAEPVATLRANAEESFGVRGYSSLDAMLEAGGIDGALIVTPSDSHVAVIERVAGSGLAILCEKPCGVSSADTSRAREIVTELGLPLQVAYWRRFVPELREIKDRIENGDFGELLSLTCLQWDGEPPAASFRSRSGGIFVDMGVHEFDQARWLIASDLHDLRAVASSIVTDPESAGDPDAAQVLGRSASGATVVVTLGRHYAGGDVASVEVFGTRDHQHSVFLDPADGERAQLAALRLQASAFAEFARGGLCRGATVDDAIAALEAAETLRVQV